MFKRTHPLLRRTAVLASLFPIVTGCAHVSCCFVFESTDAGVVRHTVIGIGTISIAGGNAKGVLATQATALGVALSSRPAPSFTIGYGNSTVLTVPADLPNALIEVSNCENGPGLIVKACFPETK